MYPAYIDVPETSSGGSVKTQYYIQKDGGETPELQPVMSLYPDGIFTFLANLYEGQGPVYGTYQTPQKSIFPIPKDKTRAPVQCFVPEPSYLN